VKPWERLAEATAPDGSTLELRRRGHEYLIYAGGYDLMSSEDDASSVALAELGCAHLRGSSSARVLVGGLGMGYTLRAALDQVGAECSVEVAELVPAVVEWNRQWLGDLAGRPLEDERTVLRVGDVGAIIGRVRAAYDAILLDVDNGPDALAHDQNEALYGARGIRRAIDALRPGGVLAVWSFDDDKGFTRRLQKAGLAVETHKVSASRKGRGRYHQVWTARLPKRAR
jgi:spermidine synthase